MSQQIGGYPPATTAGSPAGQPTTQVARDEATEVGRTAADAGRQVAGTAAEQAANVAQEVKTQARDLVGEARGQVQDQARAGQQKAADGIRALSQELREMADGGQQSGTVSEVARQAAERADRLADWLGRREPGDLVEEVRSFARRRPGAFLLGAAVGRRGRRTPHPRCRGLRPGRLRPRARSTSRAHRRTGHRRSRRRPTRPGSTCPRRYRRCRSTPRRRRRAQAIPPHLPPSPCGAAAPGRPVRPRRPTRSTGPPAPSGSTSTTSIVPPGSGAAAPTR